MKKFKNITVAIHEEYFELAIAMLMDFTTQGIQEDFDKLIITFNEDDWGDDVRTELIESLSIVYPDVKIEKEETIHAENWNEEFEKNVPLINVSDRIAIAPEWKKHESNAELTIIINPKMSFGTGQHETTRLVSRLLEKYVQQGQFWIDAGTGTGVLGILAVKLGAKSCYAFDNDIWSVENTLENIVLNEVEDKMEVVQVEIDNVELPLADGIVANLFANLIIKSAPKFANSLPIGAPLLVSGILVYDKDDVISAAENAGFRFAEIIQEAEWVAIAFEKV
jgi:ribosomal protein L11 methyltransferase